MAHTIMYILYIAKIFGDPRVINVAIGQGLRIISLKKSKISLHGINCEKLADNNVIQKMILCK